MTSLELNAEMLRNMSIIAEDENLLKRVTKYLRKVVAEKQTDSALMTKEEFFARIDHANQGELFEMQPGEDLTTFLKRQGYGI